MQIIRDQIFPHFEFGDQKFGKKSVLHVQLTEVGQLLRVL